MTLQHVSVLVNHPVGSVDIELPRYHSPQLLRHFYRGVESYTGCPGQRCLLTTLSLVLPECLTRAYVWLAPIHSPQLRTTHKLPKSLLSVPVQLLGPRQHPKQLPQSEQQSAHSLCSWRGTWDSWIDCSDSVWKLGGGVASYAGADMENEEKQWPSTKTGLQEAMPIPGNDTGTWRHPAACGRQYAKQFNYYRLVFFASML